jgi:hypothetical protein
MAGIFRFLIVQKLLKKCQVVPITLIGSDRVEAFDARHLPQRNTTADNLPKCAPAMRRPYRRAHTGAALKR